MTENEAFLQLIRSAQSSIQILPEEAATYVLPNIDYDSQLLAIERLIHRQRQANIQTQEELAQSEAAVEQSFDIAHDFAISHWEGMLHYTTYEGAAHSMSAVGMLAPMIESVFYQAFHGIRTRFYVSTVQPSAHPRWNYSIDNQWDCHLVLANGRRTTNIVGGILELADATSLLPYLPDDLKETLDALFAYRNKMFHCGFEWPVEERRKFAQRIKNDKWPSEWFSCSTEDGEPWIHYMTDVFIDHCIKTIQKVIFGIGKYVIETPHPSSRIDTNP